jgi:hypothetical protein
VPQRSAAVGSLLDSAGEAEDPAPALQFGTEPGANPTYDTCPINAFWRSARGEFVDYAT